MLLETHRVNTAGRGILRDESKGTGKESAMKAESMILEATASYGFLLWFTVQLPYVFHREVSAL